MKVILADTAGFCMGVALALRKLNRAIGNKPDGVRVYTHGPIIHNPQVLSRYRERGVEIFFPEIQLKRGDIVVVRAHGIALYEEEFVQSLGARIIDATCPKVKKAQLLIAEQSALGQKLLLFGEPEHPEVKGLVSYASAGYCVFEDIAELERVLPDGKFFLASQTTQDRGHFEEVKEILAGHKDTSVPVIDTICDATKERQEEVKELAAMADYMVVAGGYASGNTRRLVKVAKEMGVECVHVETADELPMDELKGCRAIGLSAGASTPADVIDNVYKRLLSLP